MLWQHSAPDIYRNCYTRGVGKMTVQECYEQAGADFQDAMNRLGSEALIKRFALKFLQDGSYADLQAGLAEKDAEKAFRAAHTLKGVCANLGFESLYQVSSALTEKLRGREIKDCDGLYQAVTVQYERTVAALKELQEEA